MLVTFRTKAHPDITMFGDVALRLLKTMGHSGTVPSAMLPQDIPAALRRLRAALASDEGTAPLERPAGQDDEAEEDRVSLKNRAAPLMQLLEAAERRKVPVTWTE